MTRNKSNIALCVAWSMNYLNKFDVVKEGINLLLEQMSETISEGRRIEIRGFGSFKVKEYDGGVVRARNLKTGEVTKKRRKPKVAFKAGKGLRECLKVGK